MCEQYHHKKVICVIKTFMKSLRIAHSNLARYSQIAIISIALQIVCFNLFGQNAENEKIRSEVEYDSLFNEIMNADKYVEKLDSGAFYNLPLGIMGGGNQDPNYAILVDEVVLYSDKATFSASMVLTNPFDSSRMVFAAREVPFTFKGGIQGTIRLELISEKPVTVCEDIGLEILKGSYVEADCQGFKSLHIKGRFELNEEKYILAGTDGKPKKGKVTSYFESTVQNWNDLTFSISVDPFQLVDYPDFTFQCQDLSVDFSDLKNPSALHFPKGYDSPYPNDMIQLWRGVYIQEARLILSGERFQRKNNPDPLAFGVEDLIIDELGFTGKAFAENLVSLEQGSLAGWNFSIERFELEFIMNDLTAGGLEGRVHVPVFKDSTNFQYDAYVDVKGNYGFTVKPDDTLSFEMFGKSRLDLYETSYINVKSDSNGFVPTACFNGKMTINGKIKPADGETTTATAEKDSKGTLKMADIEFEQFRVSTEEPKVNIEYMAYHGTGQSKLSKFPITISDMVFSSDPTKAKLSITAAVNLKEDSGEGFSGASTIDILATREDYKYKFKGVEVGAIEINISKPKAYTITGSIAFARGDTIYGDGFKGFLTADFAGGIELEANALFGHVNGYRYFYVDGMVAKKPGIPAGPIIIYGFGGGLYHQMRQMPGATGAQYDFGRTSSDLVYAPDNNIGIGLKAGVRFGMGSEQAVNAKAMFEIAFTKHDGISYIAFQGQARCITPPIEINAEQIKDLAGTVAEGNEETIKKPSSAANRGAISATINMFKDFENDEFHADMEMFVNIGGILTGIGSENRAGWAVVHSSPEEWYMHIGTPTDPLGIDFIGLAQLRAYFMAGDRMPATMPIHPEVVRILGLTPEEVAGGRNENSLSAGSGIAFGASFDVSTGDKSFWKFYANFSLGAGFDILLGDYGENAYCEGSAPPLGINGWYATGQAYAYFSGNIGIEATVFKKPKKFEILSIATAAYLKAEAPNPVWMIGFVGGRYSILGGMIKGKCRFEVEVGERCDIRAAQEKSALSNLPLIGDITPGNKESDVDVFTTPQVVFNVPVGIEQKIAEDDGSAMYFRINLEELSIYQGETEITYADSWNGRKDVVQIVPDMVLYPNTDYTVKARISFEEKVNGVWKVFEENGEPMVEERIAEFQTGELPDKIPASEVSYSYPINRQFNFLYGEYPNAYLTFKRDLQAFFAPSEKYDKKARWTTGTNSALTEINYTSDDKTLYMNVPESLELNSIYLLELVAIPIAENSDADRNVNENIDTEEGSNDTTSVEITTKEAEGTITTTEEKVIYMLDFKTSQYADFDSRFSSSQTNVRALYDAGFYEFMMFIDIPGGEAFDIYERPAGNKFSMIQIEMDLPNTDWFTDDVYPKTYENYPWYDYQAIKWRDTNTYGLKAQEAILVFQPSEFNSLTDEDIAAGYPISYVSFSDLVFMQAYYWDEDYMQIRDALAFYTKDEEVEDETIQTILDNIKLRPLKPGDYPIKISYVLPGKNIVTSSKIFTVTSTINTATEDE